MSFTKVYFHVHKRLYDKIAVKTKGFKDIDAILSDLIINNLLDDEERDELRSEGVL